MFPPLSTRIICSRRMLKTGNTMDSRTHFSSRQISGLSLNSDALLCRFPWCFPHFTQITFPPFHWIIAWSFLQSLLYSVHSASFQLVLSEIVSLVHKFFHTFVTGGNFHILHSTSWPISAPMILNLWSSMTVTWEGENIIYWAEIDQQLLKFFQLWDSRALIFSFI